MKKVAIYARYSTDKQREASIEDQFRLCRSYAKKQGWQVVEEYSDKAQSGAKKDRPAYQQMLTDAEAKKFDIILVEHLDRLSRRLSEMSDLYDRVEYFRAKIFTPNGEVSRMEIVFKGEMAQQYLKDLAEKTHRGLYGRAKEGSSAGGISYGYVVECDENGEPLKGSRKIDPEQADIVRRIFKEFAAGRGYREIAGLLNREEVPSPRGKSWAGTAIRAMLANEIYVGRMVWNRREWRRHPDTRKRKPEKRAANEWVVTKVPALRIVNDKLWAKVQKRRDELLAEHKERTKHGKRSHGGTRTVHLFSGLIKCGKCGASYIKGNRTHYLCANRANRRQSDPMWCDAPTVPKDVLEERLLHSIKTQLFDERSFSFFKRQAKRILEQRVKDRKKDAGSLRRDFDKVENKLGKVAAAIEESGHSKTLLARLKELEADKARLEAQLETDLPPIASVEELLEDTLSRYARIAFSIEDYAERDAAKARAMIKNLVGGEIVLESPEDGVLNARLRGSYVGLVGLVQSTLPRKKARDLWPLIQAMAQWSADATLESHDAGYPRRKRLPRSHYKKELSKKEAPSGSAGGSKAMMVAGAGFEPATFRL